MRVNSERTFILFWTIGARFSVEFIITSEKRNVADAL